MSLSQNIYSPKQAAEFLGISLLELQQLGRQGDATLRRYKGKDYYLGGELDCIKPDIQKRLKISKIPA